MSTESVKNEITNTIQKTISKAKSEIGPVSLNFEIPMYNVSKLQVKYLKIQNDSKG